MISAALLTFWLLDDVPTTVDTLIEDARLDRVLNLRQNCLHSISPRAVAMQVVGRFRLLPAQLVLLCVIAKLHVDSALGCADICIFDISHLLIHLLHLSDQMIQITGQLFILYFFIFGPQVDPLYRCHLVECSLGLVQFFDLGSRGRVSLLTSVLVAFVGAARSKSGLANSIYFQASRTSTCGLGLGKLGKFFSLFRLLSHLGQLLFCVLSDS